LNYAAQAQLAEVVFPKLEKRQLRDEYDAGARTQNRGCVVREMGLEARSSKRRERKRPSLWGVNERKRNAGPSLSLITQTYYYRLQREGAEISLQRILLSDMTPITIGAPKRSKS